MSNYDPNAVPGAQQQEEEDFNLEISSSLPIDARVRFIFKPRGPTVHTERSLTIEGPVIKVIIGERIVHKTYAKVLTQHLISKHQPVPRFLWSWIEDGVNCTLSDELLGTGARTNNCDDTGAKSQ